MAQLAQLLVKFPALLECSSFVFVPGPNDVLGGSGTLLPRLPLPDIVTAELSRRVPASVFTSNPCRIKFYSQELVLFREDACARLRKYSRRPKEGDIPLHVHALKTMLSQSHLCPLPLEAAPIDWAHDHALRLYPLPHVLLLAGRGGEFNVTERALRAANPGCFGSDFSFAVYRPFVGAVPDGKGRDHQGELDIYTLDGEQVDRETVAERARAEDRPQRKKRRTRPDAPPRRPAVVAAAPGGAPDSEAPEDAREAAPAGHKTPKDRRPAAAQRRDTPCGKRAAVPPVGRSQPTIGGFFLARQVDEAPLRGRRRLTQQGDSDGSEDSGEVYLGEDVAAEEGGEAAKEDGEAEEWDGSRPADGLGGSGQEGSSDEQPDEVRPHPTALPASKVAPRRARRRLDEESDSE
jgi:hypothetical protein